MAKRLPAATRALKDFHKLGRRLLTANPDTIDALTGRRSRGGLKPLIDELGRNRNELTKARKFARLFDVKQLERLCRVQSPEKKRLTKSHICRLVTVRNRRRRNSLAMACARNGWTVRQLELRIAKHQAKRPYGGRTVQPPETLEEFLVHVQDGTKQWLRYLQSVGSNQNRESDVLWTDVPTQLKRRFSRIGAEMRKLLAHLEASS